MTQRQRPALLTRLALVTGLAGAGVLAAAHMPIHAASTPAATDDTLTLYPPRSVHAPGQARVKRYGPQDTNHPRHGLGLAGVASPAATTANPSASPQSAALTAGTAPASVDLSRYAPPIGDQGQVNACVAWATIYGLRGWYANRDGYYPAGGSGGTGSFEPMYTYAQIVKGQNNPTSFDDNLNIAASQGVDTRADYAQGDDDYTDQPTSSETANAARYKIASWTSLSTGGGARASIENALSSGNPVAIGIPVYSNFYNAGASSYYVDVPTAGMTKSGSHAVFAIKYDSNGIWVQNSWGSGWGLDGTAELSWAFVDQYAWQIVEMTPSAPAAVATSTPPPTNTAAPTNTSMPTTTAVPTKTVAPTTTATAVPTKTVAPTTTPIPANTAAPTNTPVPTATAAPTKTLTPGGDFSMNSGRTALTVARGGTVGDTLTLNGLNGKVTLSVGGLPRRAGYSFSVNPVTLNGQNASTTLSISPTRWASPGTYTLTITAIDGAYAHTVTVSLTVS
jgi:hypothetical protein